MYVTVMTTPRSRLIDPAATCYYHCVSRCVRRAFLCGIDSASGRDFTHRRTWIERRLHAMSRIFTLDLCAYAVMSNHYHVVLHINTRANAALSEVDVVRRWSNLYRLPLGFSDLDRRSRSCIIQTWRERLCSISWFMKSVNEPLARAANKEDECSGKFWEGRFRSQALLDEGALARCMAYVDLNPLRSGLAKTLDEAHFTSIKARLDEKPLSLAPFNHGQVASNFTLPFSKTDYVEFVDLSARFIHDGKSGCLPGHLPPLEERLSDSGIPTWLKHMGVLASRYVRALGSRVSLEAYRDFLGQKRLNGLRTS